MDIYFILWVIIQYSFMHFVAQIIPSDGPWELFQSVLAVPLICPHHLVCVVFARALSYFR